MDGMEKETLVHIPQELKDNQKVLYKECYAEEIDKQIKITNSLKDRNYKDFFSKKQETTQWKQSHFY